MVAVLAFCFWYSPRKLIALISTAIAAVAIAAIAPASYWQEIESISDTDSGTADHRIELWTIATREFLDNPVLGVGPGNFRWRIADYQTNEQQQKFGRSLAASAVVHSTYFEILSELGAVGVGSFIAMIFFLFRDLRRIEGACTAILKRTPKNSREHDLEWARAYALSLQGALIGFLVSSAFLSTSYVSNIWFLGGAAAALHFVAADRFAEIRRRGASRSSLPGVPAPAGVPGGASNAEPPPRVSEILGLKARR